VNFWCTCARSRCTHGSIFLWAGSYNRGIKSWSNFLYVSLVVTWQTYLFCKSRPLWTFFTMSDFFCLWEKKLLVLYYKQQRNKWCPFFCLKMWADSEVSWCVLCVLLGLHPCTLLFVHFWSICAYGPYTRCSNGNNKFLIPKCSFMKLKLRLGHLFP
jgi:hypothetical protein